jgi:hypothetical protein
MSSMTFREKRALISLLALWIVGVAYAFGLRRGIPQNLIAADLGLVTAWILASAILIISYIALVIAVGTKEARRPSDERDRLVQLASQRNAGWVGTVGLWLVMYLAMSATPHSMIAWAALALFLLGQIVMYGSELFYYRRGL